MEFSAIIFDCDGVLVDSVGLGNQALINLLASWTTSQEVIPILEDNPGVKLQDLFRILERELQLVLPLDFEASYRTESKRLFEESLQPIPKVAQLLDQLSCPVAVASNGPLFKTRRNLEITGLLPYFDPHVYSAYEVGRWKPDPALFLHAASALGIPPNECLVVEDSAPGIQAALEGGFSAIGYAPSGHFPGLPDKNVPLVQSLLDILVLRGL